MANDLMTRNGFGMMDPFERMAQRLWAPFDDS